MWGGESDPKKRPSEHSLHVRDQAPVTMRVLYLNDSMNTVTYSPLTLLFRKNLGRKMAAKPLFWKQISIGAGEEDNRFGGT